MNQNSPFNALFLIWAAVISTPSCGADVNATSGSNSGGGATDIATGGTPSGSTTDTAAGGAPTGSSTDTATGGAVNIATGGAPTVATGGAPMVATGGASTGGSTWTGPCLGLNGSPSTGLPCCPGLVTLYFGHGTFHCRYPGDVLVECNDHGTIYLTLSPCPTFATGGATSVNSSAPMGGAGGGGPEQDAGVAADADVDADAP